MHKEIISSENLNDRTKSADTKQNKGIREKDKVPFHFEMTVGIKSVLKSAISNCCSHNRGVITTTVSDFCCPLVQIRDGLYLLLAVSRPQQQVVVGVQTWTVMQ